MAITIRLDEFSQPADIDGAVDDDERHRFNALEFDILSISAEAKSWWMRYNCVGVFGPYKRH